jgi:ornithine cyclodeaminase/alanine dehydrogenase-like protein (mu-crystallin family)
VRCGSCSTSTRSSTPWPTRTASSAKAKRRCRRASPRSPSATALLGLRCRPYLPSAGLACKLVSLFPENRDRHTHQALIAVFDQTNGTPVALMDGTYITATRTAAGSALATRLLAREDARRARDLGAGVQARTHADCAAAGAPLRRGPRRLTRPERARGARGEDRGDRGSSFEEAVRGADVVAATTHATEPVVLRDWLEPGAHVNSVGANPRARGEVDPAIVRDARRGAWSTASRRSRRLRRAPGVPRRRPRRVVELGELVAGEARANLAGADHPV